MKCDNCSCSLEFTEQRRAVACIVTRDGDRICGPCVAGMRNVGGGVVMTRDEIDRECERHARKYGAGGYKRGQAAAARGPKEAA